MARLAAANAAATRHAQATTITTVTATLLIKKPIKALVKIVPELIKIRRTVSRLFTILTGTLIFIIRTAPPSRVV